MKKLYIKRVIEDYLNPEDEEFEVLNNNNKLLFTCSRIEMIDGYPPEFYNEFCEKESKYLLSNLSRPQVILVCFNDRVYKDIIDCAKINKEIPVDKPIASWVDSFIQKIYELTPKYFKDKYDPKSKFWEVD